jgi:hypothetical protein
VKLIRAPRVIEVAYPGGVVTGGQFRHRSLFQAEEE